MNQTKLILANDASTRADKFRADLVIWLQENKTDLSPKEKEAYELLSQAYALTGNLQMHVNEYCNEMNKLKARGLI